VKFEEARDRQIAPGKPPQLAKGSSYAVVLPRRIGVALVVDAQSPADAPTM
jgi:hypothetical protein